MLKSWAVTRGPSLTLGEKRLAVRTEDHPIEYLDFEGNIPKGEYGGGSMIVWDRGRWTPDGDPHRGSPKGISHSRSTATRLKGRWHLVRIKPRPGEKTEPWLLIKAEDAFARHAGRRRKSPTRRPPRSSAGAPMRSSRPRASCARTTRRAPRSRATDRAARHRARSRARARPAAGISSSRAWHRRARSRRAGRNGFTRSSTTATGSRRASTAARSGCSPARRSTGRSASRRIADALEGARPRLGADRRRDRGRGCGRHFELQQSAGGSEDRPAGPVSLFRLRSALLRGLRPHQGGAGRPQGAAGAGRSPACPPTRRSGSASISRPTGRPCWSIRAGSASKASSPSARTCRTGPAAASIGSRPSAGSSQEFVILGYVASTAREPLGRLVAARLLRRRRARLCGPGRHRLVAGHARSRSMRCSRRSESSKPALAKPMPAGAEKGVIWVEPRLVCADRVSRLDPRRADPAGLVQGTAGGQSRRKTSRWRSHQTRRDAAIDERPRRHQADPSRAHPVAGAGHHQAGPRGILRRHRRLDFAASSPGGC